MHRLEWKREVATLTVVEAFMRMIGMVAVVGVSLSSVAHAQVCSWQTVDDFVPDLAVSPLGAAAADAVETAAGLRVAGISIVSPTEYRWVVRRQTNGGVWSTVDELAPAGIRSHPEDLLRTAGGQLLVVGGENDASNYGRWLVRRAVNNPATAWSTADAFQGATPASGFAHAVTVDNSDVIYVGGHAAIDPDPNTYHWIVRTSSDQGATWTTASDVVSFAGSASVMGLGSRAGVVYATGYNWDGTQYHWQTRRKLAGSNVWTLVDDYTPRPSPSTLPYGAIPTHIIAPRGNIVVAGGSEVDDAGLNRWVVRRANSAAGLGWTTVDNVGPVCHLRGLAYDSTDRLLYASGRCREEDGTYHWRTRISTDEGLTWADDDDYVLTTGRDSLANGVHARGPTGTYAVGTAEDSNGVRHWVVRQRQCVVAPVAALRAARPAVKLK
jgi:uncharacterized protein YjeT (DUF2065 family)